MSASSVLVFDMDGVLADVRDSYLSAIALTVEHFTGAAALRETIDQYKRAGGWNNDWQLAHELIRRAGREIPYDEVVCVFQKIFLGDHFDGLILQEKWIPQGDCLERLERTNRLAIFSGRPRAEIDFTLKRFAPGLTWACIIGDEDVSRPKPAPDGLRMVAEQTNSRDLAYVGDSVDDARSARASNVSFIGVADRNQVSLAEALCAEGATAIVESVNELEEVLYAQR
jgi:HAD superfamily phosphatase